MILCKFREDREDEPIIRLQLREARHGMVLAVVDSKGNKVATLLTINADGEIVMAAGVPESLGLPLTSGNKMVVK